MEIFPAIDLLDSKAVRLTKGDKSSAKIYGNALDFAKYFEDCGAKWLHVIDLDGAFEGSPRNLNTIESIVNNTSLRVQVGGGIRTEETIINYMRTGATRTILGSIAVQDSEWCKNMALQYPIAISIDSKHGKVATHGWVEVSQIDALSFVKRFANSQIEAIICTDINQDGLLSGMNLRLTQEIACASNIFTIASGGFSNIKELDEIKKYSQIGGVIIGKAFYEGIVDFKNIKF
ncbi:1-(5-phosphoribosyl)-5-[(5-phosphoribosylamino)methylideneamino]imidazole-4-carboxamide isomerase [Helicobacter didelphidarum]|uniref:1-(5-phosphoribosyl)-5-[(5-phosphoribosylamino)methylideneamino] imidazole-4-carboxamide isomerase n=1 Tax=Helicobacter didelphidarum TaxID=2040648 RepID=A0A3D8IPY9_9HELI|nr:1-(5-phosphoribosyl)-5-[(5-phosphoribosylamino)methylideneamino]imidazole-4-carboxamide isomerase [Helicobacter didelphidarum]RDU66985.1 1-(5-phosphoribosyl)-5-[(5-phosphoribosylamino)methylideneamino]imidazole-4-carboxamide isomerase [Helicobacter didelphidarum]